MYREALEVVIMETIYLNDRATLLFNSFTAPQLWGDEAP